MNPRRLTPSMSQLLAFEAAARHLSFTRAAQELSLTQSAVSRQVQSLEDLLQIALFRREGRHIVLTEAGDTYQMELGAALQRIRNASLQAIASNSSAGAIHLAVLPTFAAKWLMPRLHGFYAEHPGVLVHIHSRTGRFDLQLAGIDAVIGVGEGAAEAIWPGLVPYRLMSETLLPVVSPALARSQPLREPVDLTQHLLLQVAARADVWRRWFAAQGLPHRCMLPGHQFELTLHLIQAVASGAGVGLVPSFLIQDELRSGTLQPALDLPLQTGAAYYLFVAPDKLKLAPIAAFTRWLRQVQ